MSRSNSVEQYLTAFDGSARIRLEKMRATILKAAPGAEELISYKIPAVKLDGMLVWYAAYKNHIGFYPRASAIKKFIKELSGFKKAKGSVQFPHDRPLPLALIRKIVKFRVAENLKRTKKIKKR